MSSTLVNLEWKNITVSVDGERNKQKWWKLKSESPIERLEIIKNVSGNVKSGQLIAVLGSSGSGKTTLLAAISQRIRGRTTGDILLNGKILSRRDMTKISAFVPQYDIAVKSLTTFEHLYFMSQFKMDRNLSNHMKNSQIDMVLQTLGLESCRHSQILMLSGGERKKLSLAMELLTEPLILFCDEPTTGLDSYNALSVMKTLRNLSVDHDLLDRNGVLGNSEMQIVDDRNEKIESLISYDHDFHMNSNVSSKAVVCSIHQPTSDIFECFSHIILMNSGRIVFQGTVGEAEQFFTRLNLACPANYNPAEHYVKHVRSLNDDETVESNVIEKIYQQYEADKKNSNKSLVLSSPGGDVIRGSRNGKMKRITWLSQIYFLLCRSWINARRSLWEIFIATFVFSLSAGTISLLYSNVVSLTQTSIQDIQGSIILITTETVFTFSYGVIFRFRMDMPMLRRETGEKFYSISAFYVSSIISKIPLIIIQCFIFVGIISLSVTYINSIYIYLSMSFIVAVCGVTATAYGFLLAGLFDGMNLATQIASPIDLILLIFGGFYVNLSSFPIIKYLSLFYFGNEALSYIVWSNVKSINCSENLGHPCMHNGTEVLMEYAFSFESYTLLTDYLGLIVMAIIMHLFGFFGLSHYVRRVGYY